MECLEGETLAARLQSKPRGLPLEEALHIATEIASALAAAHRRGIVHRDLKPANVMLTKTGAKLLDFGLAKLRPPAVPAGTSAVMTEAPLTAPTTLLGTLQYMAPEQIDGRDADARSDIFAFGCVLYEMLTGRRAFEGSSPASVIAAILEREPPGLLDRQPLAPPLLGDLVRSCMAKDRDQRWQSAADLERALTWLAKSPAPASISRSDRSRVRLLRALPAAILLLMAGALAGRWLSQTPSDARAVLLSVVPPAGATRHARTTESVEMALSPDGRAIAFIASSSGERRLFVRPLDSPESRRVEASEGADHPFWSPDSSMIGFFAKGKLKKVSNAGGVPQVLCDVGRQGGGATWNQDGVIVFSPFFEGALFRVSSSGGAVTPLTSLDMAKGETHHFRPRFLPDGRHFLFQVYARVGHGEYVGSIDSMERRLLIEASALPAGFMGHIADYALAGEPVRIAEGIARVPGGAAAFTASSGAGIVAYRTADPQKTTRLTWFDRAGRAIGWAGSPAAYEDPALSPDGRRVAVQRWDTPERRSIWIIDSERGTETRFTTNPDDMGPLWSPDGTRIVYSSARDTPPNLFVRSVSGAESSEDRLFMSRFFHFPTGWSADGQRIVHGMFAAETGYDLLVLDLKTKTSTPLAQTAYDEKNASLSTDGRWVAYTSDETGRSEVYIKPMAGSGRTMRISTNGGEYPAWRPDGREVFYLEARTKLMSVALATNGAPAAGQPTALFEARFGPSERRPYDVSADGRRVLVNLVVDEVTASPITVIVNWPAMSARR